MFIVAIKLRVLKLLARYISINGALKRACIRTVVHVMQVSIVSDFCVVINGADRQVVRTQLSRVQNPLQIAHLRTEFDRVLTKLL